MRHYLSLIKLMPSSYVQSIIQSLLRQGQYFHALDRISRGIINVQQQDLSLWYV